MRCNKCNVDLPETYKSCPLCHSATIDEEVKIKGMSAVSYPKGPAPKEDELEKAKIPFCFEKVKAFFNR